MEQTVDTSSPVVNEAAPRLYNRRERRTIAAMRLKQQKDQVGKSKQRLKNFKMLQDWKQHQEGKQKYTTDQIGNVFKVALAKLFKRDYTDLEFQAKLQVISSNIRKGFEYEEMKVKDEGTASTAAAE